jgi:hypothetical protein
LADAEVTKVGVTDAVLSVGFGSAPVRVANYSKDSFAGRELAGVTPFLIGRTHSLALPVGTD